MVASDPLERPGSPDFLVNELRALRRRVDALARQSKYPFSVSHDGVPEFEVVPDEQDPAGGARIRIGNGNGKPVFETFYSPAWGGKSAHMYDLAGNVVWALDEVAGYGISHPTLALNLTGFEELDFAAASAEGTAGERAAGFGFFYNPALVVTARVRTATKTVNRPTDPADRDDATGETGGETAEAAEIETGARNHAWLEVEIGGEVVARSQTRSWALTPGTVDVTLLQKAVLLPRTAVGRTGVVRVRMWNPAGADASVAVYPMQCCGVSKALYDQNPGLH